MKTNAKATTEYCTKQIKRLAGLAYYPAADKAALTELVRALANAAESDEHARRVVDRWLATQTETPRPANLTRLAREIPVVESTPDGCEICQGRPWVQRWKCECGNVNPEADTVCPCGRRRTLNVIWFAGRCECAKGLYLRGRDAERRAS